MKTREKVFWLVLIALSVYAFCIIMEWTHLTMRHDGHEYERFSYPDYCPTCVCFIHEDCWPGRED